MLKRLCRGRPCIDSIRLLELSRDNCHNYLLQIVGLRYKQHKESSCFYDVSLRLVCIDVLIVVFPQKCRYGWSAGVTNTCFNVG